jgi:hypothetical protein
VPLFSARPGGGRRQGRLRFGGHKALRRKQKTCANRTSNNRSHTYLSCRTQQTELQLSLKTVIIWLMRRQIFCLFCHYYFSFYRSSVSCPLRRAQTSKKFSQWLAKTMALRNMATPQKTLKKGPLRRAALFPKLCVRGYIMPPMPPMPLMSGIAGAAPAGAGLSATIASVVINRPATEAASRRAVVTTLAGSTMPAAMRSQ